MPIFLLIGMFNNQGYIDLNKQYTPEEHTVGIEIEIEDRYPIEKQIEFVKNNLHNMDDIDIDYYCKSNKFDNNLLRYTERSKYISYLKFKNESESSIDKKTREDIQHTIFNMCRDTGIDYLFLLAVIKLESNFRPRAIHTNVGGSAPGSQDRGLFQINSKYELGYTYEVADGGYDVFNWYDNAYVAVERFKKYLKEFGDYEAMACAWNKGAGRLKEADYDDVDYVRVVFKYYDELYENYINCYLN